MKIWLIALFLVGILVLAIVVSKLASRQTGPPPAPPSQLKEQLPAVKKIPPARFPVASAAADLQLSIPSGWVKYNKRFQAVNFSFYYPAGLSIEDGDESSGSIELLKMGQERVSVLFIGRYPYNGWANPEYVQATSYKSGPVSAWLAKIVNLEYSTAYTENDYTLSPLGFRNGKKYNLVTSLVDDKGDAVEPLTPTDNDFYLGIFGGKGIFIRDLRVLPVEDLYRILQTLTVN